MGMDLDCGLVDALTQSLLLLRALHRHAYSLHICQGISTILSDASLAIRLE